MPYVAHPVFSEPTDVNAPIWRYMSFTKLVSLLDRRALYFARADLLAESDRFEGSMSRVNLQVLPQVLRSIGVNDETIEGLARSRADFGRALVGHTFLNCWTAVPYESIAMWRMYVGDADGVAIRSTFAHLTDSMRKHVGRRRPVYVGGVRYIDYDRDPIPEGNILWPWVHKRKAFEHEREIRAVVRDVRYMPDNTIVPSPHPDRGKFVKVDLATLIDEVRVSPASTASFVELVEAVTRRYRLKKTVGQSELTAEPSF